MKAVTGLRYGPGNCGSVAGTRTGWCFIKLEVAAPILPEWVFSELPARDEFDRKTLWLEYQPGQTVFTK